MNTPQQTGAPPLPGVLDVSSQLTRIGRVEITLPKPFSAYCVQTNLSLEALALTFVVLVCLQKASGPDFKRFARIILE
jgi:hypothetical protein